MNTVKLVSCFVWAANKLILLFLTDACYVVAALFFDHVDVSGRITKICLFKMLHLINIFEALYTTFRNTLWFKCL